MPDLPEENLANSVSTSAVERKYHLGLLLSIGVPRQIFSNWKDKAKS